MSTQLKADNRAPSRARAFVEQALTGQRLSAALREDVVLVVSELVTNAVRAGAAKLEIAIGLTPDELVLTVDDDGPGWPTLLDAEDDATSGRGLTIVGHLADRWETSSRDDGKRVAATWSLTAVPEPRS